MSEKPTSADALYKMNSGRYRPSFPTRTPLGETSDLPTGSVIVDEDLPIKALPLADGAGGGSDRGTSVAENSDEDEGLHSSDSAGGRTAEMPAAMMEQATRVKQLMAEAVRMATSVDSAALHNQEIDPEMLDSLRSGASVLAGEVGDKRMNEQYARVGAEQWQAKLDELEAAATEVINKLPEGIGIPEEIWQSMGEVDRILDVLKNRGILTGQNFTDAGGRMDDYTYLKVGLEDAIEKNQEEAMLRQEMYQLQEKGGSIDHISQRLTTILTVLQKMEATTQSEKTDKKEVPVDILTRATALGPQLELAFKRIENVNPEELRIHGLEAGIKARLRQMADYYNNPSVADTLGDWSSRDASWDKSRQSLDRWEAVAKDIIIKFGLAAEKPEVIGAKLPDGTTVGIGKKETDPLTQEKAPESSEREEAIPQDILDKAKELSAQAAAVAARCRSLSLEDRQRLGVGIFTARRYEQLANQYDGENSRKELLSLYQASKDWKEVQLQIGKLAEGAAKLQLDMDASLTIDTSHIKADFEVDRDGQTRDLNKEDIAKQTEEVGTTEQLLMPDELAAHLVDVRQKMAHTLLLCDSLSEGTLQRYNIDPGQIEGLRQANRQYQDGDYIKGRLADGRGVNGLWQSLTRLKEMSDHIDSNITRASHFSGAKEPIASDEGKGHAEAGPTNTPESSEPKIVMDANLERLLNESQPHWSKMTGPQFHTLTWDFLRQVLRKDGNDEATINRVIAETAKVPASEEAPSGASAEAPVSEDPVSDPEVPTVETAIIPDTQAEQQHSMEQAEKERITEIKHQQALVMGTIMELWKHIPAKEQQNEAMSWQDVRAYLQSHGGNLDGYPAQAMAELTKRNQGYEKSQSTKQASEAGLQKDLLDTLLLEQKLLVGAINEKDPGLAGNILLRREIAQRAEGKFDGSFGQSEHPVEKWLVDGVNVGEFKKIAEAKADFMTMARDKGQMETIMASLAALPAGATKAEVERIVAPLQQSNHFNFEAVKQQIERANHTAHGRALTNLPNGLVLEMIHNNANDTRAVTVHQPLREITPDTQLSIDDGRIQRSGMAEFNGDNLTGDKLGWGNNVEVYFSTQDKNGTESGLLKIDFNNGQWRIQGKLNNEIAENGRAVNKVLLVDRALSEEEVKKIRLRQGDMVLVPGLSLPVEKVADITMRYVGDQGKQIARRYDVLTSLEKQSATASRTARKNAPKSLRWSWHDQQLNNRGVVGRNAGKLKRWAKSD
jgi:hypothetical protein